MIQQISLFPLSEPLYPKESRLAQVTLPSWKRSRSLVIGLTMVLIMALHDLGQDTPFSESILSHLQSPRVKSKIE